MDEEAASERRQLRVDLLYIANDPKTDGDGANTGDGVCRHRNAPW